MRNSLRLSAILLGLGIYSPLIACSVGGSDAQVGEKTSQGTVTLPLTAVSNTGETYRLTSATFTLRDSSGTAAAVLSSDSNPAATTVTTAVAVGTYTMSLSSGWSVVQIGSDGVETPVTATLQSSSTQPVSVNESASSIVTYAFLVNGTIIQTGMGTVGVAITINNATGGSTSVGGSTSLGGSTSAGGSTSVGGSTSAGGTTSASSCTDTPRQWESCANAVAWGFCGQAWFAGYCNLSCGVCSSGTGGSTGTGGTTSANGGASTGGTPATGGTSSVAAASVVSVTPNDNSSSPANASIAVQFSAAMLPQSLTAQTAAGACTGSIQVSLDDFANCIGIAPVTVGTDASTVSLSPKPGLLVNRTYKVRVTTAAQSSNGSALGSAYTSAGFTTTNSLQLGTSVISTAGANYLSGVVVSQVYGGGGTTTGAYAYDYIELHNRGTLPVDLSTMSIQYGSLSGTGAWQVESLTGSIKPGGYYLIQAGAPGTSGIGLPEANATTSIALGSLGGKVALVNGSTALNGACPVDPAVVDLVGYGTGVNCSETAAAAAVTNTTAAIRNGSGCSDTNDNSIDFTVAAANPRNGSTTAVYCTTSGPISELWKYQGGLVVSQVFGGGGATGTSYYAQDFVELHNRSNSAVDLSGFSIQYGSQSGTTWTPVVLSGTVQAGGYYLIQLGTPSLGGGLSLPTPDLTATALVLSNSAGKVALVYGTAALIDACPADARVVDLVAYGASTNCSEVAPTAPLSTTTAAVRNFSGCLDIGNNSVDFAVATPTPHNSASAAFACSAAANESNLANEIDYCKTQFPLTLSLSAASTSPVVYGQVYEAGVTDASGASPLITAQLGYGPATVNPEYEYGWTWVTATFNTQSGNNDEYQATFTAPAAGTYRYGYRFSLDGGANWTYCDNAQGDEGAGSNPGLTFSFESLGVMTVQ